MSLALGEWVIVIPLFPFIYALAVPGRWGKLGLSYVIIPHRQYIKGAYTNICLFQRHCFTPPYNLRSKRFNILLWNHENPPLVYIWIIAFFKITSVPLWQWLLNCEGEQGVRYLFLEGCDQPDNLAEPCLPGDCPRSPANTKAGAVGGGGCSAMRGPAIAPSLLGKQNLVWKPPSGSQGEGKGYAPRNFNLNKKAIFAFLK